jgi:hypothetical protein
MTSASRLAVLTLCGLLRIASSAFAQEVDIREVSLVRQDFSDCSNTDVTKNGESPGDGTASVQRRPNGNTLVFVQISAEPNTSYHFFLKCVRLLGDLTTGADGSATATFTFRTDEAGAIFAFEAYPEGAPLGNKFQSVQVNFRDPPPPVALLSRIQYVSQVGDRVNFAYEEMPTASEVVVVNVLTGLPVEGLSVPLTYGGVGSAGVTVPSGGTYYLLARGQADKQYIAQTIRFYGY